jgi:hypothetical protein
MPETIKYHINIPCNTEDFDERQILDASSEALLSYSTESVKAFIGTEGHSGWRVSVVFNDPAQVNATNLVYQFTASCKENNIPLDAPVAAWIHP